jgi:DTW domain-containing protein YfiP
VTLPASRAVCQRCRRPEVVCYCVHLPSLPTQKRILILQHPREREVGIGTARMAHLSLPGSVLRVGVDFSSDATVAGMLEGAHLLFPGDEATDLRQLAVADPFTLVVVDGTWSQARTLVKRNPAIAALPRIGFQPRRPSNYRIRKEPADFCVSTIEALAETLAVLEGRSFDALLEPFRVMVDRQLWYSREVNSSRHSQKPPRPRPAGPTLGQRLSAEWSRLVCVQGEANGWPVHHPDRQPSEIVHFVACRPATGELYEAVIAPRRTLAPFTSEHIELPTARLSAGISLADWRRSWEAFSRPDDVLVQWGSFYSKLAIEDGLSLPRRRYDLRGELASVRQRGGTLEECVVKMEAPVTSLGLDGRGGRRLSSLLALLAALTRNA